MIVRAAAAVAALSALLALPAAAAPERSAAVRLVGKVTLIGFDLRQRCAAAREDSGKKPIVLFTCSQSGAFSGTPARAGASYGWVWSLELGPNNRTTGRGTEKGRLGLNFGGGNIVYLATKGTQVPVGKPTTAKSRARSTGTWTVAGGGTGQYKGARGSGRYTFETTLTGGRNFTQAQLTLTGTIR